MYGVNLGPLGFNRGQLVINSLVVRNSFPVWCIESRCICLIKNGFQVAIFIIIIGDVVQMVRSPKGAPLLTSLIVTGTAMKVEAPIIETPRPASVVTRDELGERNVRSLDESFHDPAALCT